jgi:hypothetical protein
MIVERNLVEILMQKSNHCGDQKYHENLTNWLNMLSIGVRVMVFNATISVKMEEKAKKKKITPIVFSDKENGNTLSLSDLCLTLPQHSFLLSLNYMYVCMYDKNLFLILSKVYSIQHYVIKFI